MEREYLVKITPIGSDSPILTRHTTRSLSPKNGHNEGVEDPIPGLEVLGPLEVKGRRSPFSYSLISLYTDYILPGGTFTVVV